MSINTVTIENITPSTASITTLNFPPNAPLDFGNLVTLFLRMAAQSSEPSDPDTGNVYLDDGTNTASSKPGFRKWNGSAWEDLGGAATGTVTSTPVSGQHTITDIRLASDLTLVVEYNDTPIP